MDDLFYSISSAEFVELKLLHADEPSSVIFQR
jgi:hypothetical protein